MTYTNSFEEDRFLATLSRESEAFKKLIEDRGGMVIPIFNNNPRAPMRDSVTRSRTTYSTRNAGGSADIGPTPKIIVDIRELGALLPSLIDAAGIEVVPATLVVGDYILSPKMCVERKALPDLEQSLANGRL
jgi:DNA excision repair protein ERCC-4